MADALQAFSQALLQHLVLPVMCSSQGVTCASKKKVPFHLPSHLSAVLRMSLAERFSVSDTIAQLVPAASFSCSKCCQASWSDPYFKCSALIITNNQALPAHGKYMTLYVGK